MSVFRHVFLRWCDVCYFFPRCCGVDSPPMPPSLLYLKPLRNGDTFLHLIYKSKKKTNLSCILNNFFQYSKILTRKQNAMKSIKTEKTFVIQPFLESGIHWARIRNPVLGIRNPKGGIQNPRLSWIPLHGATSGSEVFFVDHRSCNFQGNRTFPAGFSSSLPSLYPSQDTFNWSMRISCAASHGRVNGRKEYGHPSLRKTIR